jgi:hypothetical protein
VNVTATDSGDNSNASSKMPFSTALIVSIAINCILIGVVVWIVLWGGGIRDDIVANVTEGMAKATATNDDPALVLGQANEGDKEIGSCRMPAPVQLTSNPLYRAGNLPSSSGLTPVPLTANVLYGTGRSYALRPEAVRASSVSEAPGEAPPQPFYATMDENANFC